MTLNPAQQPAHPPEQLQRIKNLIYMLPGVSGTGFIESDGQWALKVWPKEGEELLKPVIEALSDGHTVIYATEPLEMKGTPLPPRPVLERCWNLAKERPAVVALLACLTVAVITGISVASWQWRAADAARKDALNARNRALRTFIMANEAFNVCFDQVDPHGNPDMQSRKGFLEQALFYYEAFAKEINGFEAKEVDDRTLRTHLANDYLRIGLIATDIRQHKHAASALDAAMREFQGLLNSKGENKEARTGLDRARQAIRELSSRTTPPESGEPETKP